MPYANKRRVRLRYSGVVNAPVVADDAHEVFGGRAGNLCLRLPCKSRLALYPTSLADLCASRADNEAEGVVVCGSAPPGGPILQSWPLKPDV